MTQLNGSIVLYHTDREMAGKAIKSFLTTSLDVRLYLVDNSADDSLKDLQDIDSRIEYIFNNANLGYGSGHNIAIRKSMADNVPYHLVLNPDVYYDTDVLAELYGFMESDKGVALSIPKVRYTNGEIQYVCRLLPTPMDLIFRRFLPFRGLKERMNDKFELRWTGYDRVMNVPFLLGCFMFLRTDALRDTGIFDERYFMYAEDMDLSRRLHSRYQTCFYPDAEIVHAYAKESHTSFRMLMIHTVNVCRYFFKWGWVFDSQRGRINRKAEESIRCK